MLMSSHDGKPFALQTTGLLLPLSDNREVGEEAMEFCHMASSSAPSCLISASSCCYSLEMKIRLSCHNCFFMSTSLALRLAALFECIV